MYSVRPGKVVLMPACSWTERLVGPRGSVVMLPALDDRAFIALAVFRLASPWLLAAKSSEYMVLLRGNKLSIV